MTERIEKQRILLEDTMTLKCNCNSKVQSDSRRIYYIDVSKMSEKEVDEYLNKLRKSLDANRKTTIGDLGI